MRLRSGGLRAAIALLFMAVVPLLLAACETSPATGRTIFTGGMTAERERQIGAEMHPEAVEAFGGAYQDRELQRYVDSVGQLLARTSEMPDLDFTFTVVDSPIVNAFALPGGYVYVTRGLMALARDEAELAGVLAHEIGHVTARHAAARYGSAMAATLAQIGLGTVLGGAAADVGGAGAALWLQSYSRDQEHEADMLGVRYLSRAGYSPHAMSSFLEVMLAHSRLEAALAGRPGQADAFDLMQTHPRTIDRIERAIVEARVAEVRDPMRARDIYLSKIDGMVYGDSPEQGFARNHSFAHPVLRFRFEVPDGFRLRNTPERVVATHDDGALIVFDGDRVSPGIDLRDYLTQRWAPSARLSQIERLDINGLPAATAVTRLSSRQGEMDVRLVAIRFEGEQIYRFLFATPPRMTASLSEGLRRTTYSFRRLSREEAQRLRPWRLRVHEVRPGETVAGLAARQPFADRREERFRVLNGLAPNDQVRAGDRVKLVVE